MRRSFFVIILYSLMSMCTAYAQQGVRMHDHSRPEWLMPSEPYWLRHQRQQRQDEWNNLDCPYSNCQDSRESQ